MEQHRKQTLILQLFSLFATEAQREGFENLLRSARLIVDAQGCHALPDQYRRHPLSHVHSWVRTKALGWDGPIALFVWFRDSLAGTLSSLGTLDHFVPEIRRARKIVVVPEAEWAALELLGGVPVASSWFDVPYQGIREDGQPDQRPALVLRLGDQPDYRMAIELGMFLGTRTSRQSVTNMQAVVSSAVEEAEPMPFQIGVPSLPAREDETTREVATGLQPMPIARAKRPSSSAVEVARLTGSKRPDPRCEDEDLRDTIEPPPPSPPPPRRDDTPTEPG